jgi:hypothetical protein
MLGKAAAAKAPSCDWRARLGTVSQLREGLGSGFCGTLVGKDPPLAGVEATEEAEAQEQAMEAMAKVAMAVVATAVAATVVAAATAVAVAATAVVEAAGPGVCDCLRDPNSTHPVRCAWSAAAWTLDLCLAYPAVRRDPNKTCYVMNLSYRTSWQVGLASDERIH